MITTIPYPLLGFIFCLISWRFRFLPRLPVLQSILRRKTIRIQRKQQLKDRPIEEVTEILEVELLAETSHLHTFMTIERKGKLGYRVLPVKDDDGFHTYRIKQFGINYSPDPYTAVSEFYKERNYWLQQKWMQPHKKLLASPLGSKRLHSLKLSGGLP